MTFRLPIHPVIQKLASALIPSFSIAMNQGRHHHADMRRVPIASRLATLARAPLIAAGLMSAVLAGLDLCGFVDGTLSHPVAISTGVAAGVLMASLLVDKRAHHAVSFHNARERLRPKDSLIKELLRLQSRSADPVLQGLILVLGGLVVLSNVRSDGSANAVSGAAASMVMAGQIALTIRDLPNDRRHPPHAETGGGVEIGGGGFGDGVGE